MGANSVLNAFRRRVLGRREGRDEEEASKLIPLNQKQLVVYLANRSEPLRLGYQPEQTVRDVCEEIAKQLHISPVALPFFTLISIPEEHCLNQQKKLSKTEWEQKYDFKLAFKACRASRFKQPDIDDKNVIEYLFHQSRQEFLQGIITFSEEDQDDRKNFVTLVILELIYQSRQHNIKPQKLVDNAKHYKVLDLLRRGVFQQYELKQVKSYIKDHLSKFQDLTEEKFMLEYLHVMEQSETFFVYTFTVYKQFAANGRNFNVEYELLISPKYGIKKKEAGQSSQVPEVIVKDFSQVCGLEIGQTQSNQVIISRMESKPEVLSACSPQDAQSIVAIINGYYRLLVNRYRNLNALSGSTVKSKFHGPISRKMSTSILQAKGEEDGLYLIRQSRRVFGNYVLSLMYNNSISHYEIIRDGKLLMLKDTSIKKKFENLDGFVKYYEKNQDGLPVCLKNICLPNETDNDALLNSHPLVPVTPRPQDLNQFGLESIKAQDIKLICPIRKAGEFGNVILSERREKDGENPVKIAVRKLKKKIYDESFYEVEKRLIKLRNINIIRHYGLTQLKDGVGLVTEYALWDLETYLKDNVSQPEKKSISKKSVILFAAQIAEGMMYLQEMKCVHGRLKAHNILVATDEQIKIGDFGLMDLQNHGGEFMDADQASAGYCWHALEMLADPNQTPTHESDVWSLGVTMWEMFALKRPFHASTSSKPLPREEILRRYHRDQYLSTQRENLPAAVADVIQKCWNPREEERISFTNIVTMLRDLIFKATPEECTSYSHELILEQKTEDWEKPIKQLKEDKQRSIKQLKLIAADDSYSVMAPREDNHSIEYASYGIRGRKTSIQRTFSDPGSPERVFEGPIIEHLLTLPQRKVSLTRASSCPQCKLRTQQEKSTPSEEKMDEIDKNKPMSTQAADYTLYHGEMNVFNNISENNHVMSTDDEHNQLMNDSYLQSDQQQSPMDAEDKAMEFLGKQLSLKPEDSGLSNQKDNLLSKGHDTKNLDQKEHKEDHDVAMAFLGSIIVKQKETGPPQPGSASTGQYQGHPGTVSPSEPDNSATGQYQDHPGVVSTSEPDNSFIGQYQGLPGVVNPFEPGNSFIGQYQGHPGVVSTFEPGNSATGQYQGHPGVISTSEPGNSATGQYQGLPGVVNPFEPGNSATGQYQGHPGVVSTFEPDNSATGPYQGHSGVVSTFEPGSSATGQYQGHPGVISTFEPGNSATGQYQGHPGVVSTFEPGSSATGQYQGHPGVVHPFEPGNSATGQYQGLPGVVSTFEPGNSATGQYQGHPGVVNPFEPGNSATGQYQDHPGVVSPFKPGNSATGQYQDHPGVVSPFKPGNSATGQYQDHPGVVSPFKPGNSATGQYQDHPGVVSPFKPGNSATGQYQDHPDVCPINSGKGTACLSEVKPFLSQGLEGFVRCHKEGTGHTSLDHCEIGHVKGTQLKGHMEEHASTSETSVEVSGGWFCVDPTAGCGKGDDLQIPMKTTPVQENPEEHWPICEASAISPGKLVATDLNEMNPHHSEMPNMSLPNASAPLQDDQSKGCSKGYKIQAPLKTTPVQENQGGHQPICKEPAISPGKLDATDLNKMNQHPSEMPNMSLPNASAPLQDDQSKDETRSKKFEELQEKIRPDFRIEKANLRPTKEIGRGNFGIVRIGSLRRYRKSVPAEEVAVKELKKCPDEKSQDDFITEAINMQELSKIKNPNIVALIGICLDTESEVFYIVTELAPLGDLPKYLKEKKARIGVDKLLEFCLQIANGMMSLESEEVLHRDLALRNILVAAEDQVKISDFGLSRLSDYYKTNRGQWPMKWYAPESLEKGRFTTKSDVWSYGITVWEMFNYGELKPYPDVDNSKILDHILNGYRLPQPANCPDGVYEIMMQCWDQESEKRPTFYYLWKQLIPKEIEKLPTYETVN